ncbi:MAG: DUF7691 family protein [Tepidisphaeraceae bacterium]
MSYSLVPYLVDLPAVIAAVGSNDSALINAIERSNSRRFNADEFDDGMTIGDAVRQLVNATPRRDVSGHLYGYAFETLCNQLGKALPSDLWCGVRWATMEDSQVAQIMKSGSPVSLPPIQDFPMIGYLTRKTIQSLVHRMGTEGLTNANKELQELLREFESWLREAARVDRDLVFFYY